MSIALGKDSIDLGIVVVDAEKSLAFYRDLLGLPSLGEMPMPGGSTMYMLTAGSSLVKLVHPRKEPKSAAAPGGIPGAYGFRYFTITVSNIAEIVAEVGAAGHKVVMPVTELAPGITIAIVEDPDGNWVEFLQN